MQCLLWKHIQNHDKCNKPRVFITSVWFWAHTKKGGARPQGRMADTWSEARPEPRVGSPDPVPPWPAMACHALPFLYGSRIKRKCVKTRGLLHLMWFPLCFHNESVFIMICYVFIWFQMISIRSKPILTTPHLFENHFKSIPGIIINSKRFYPILPNLISLGTVFICTCVYMYV